MSIFDRLLLAIYSFCLAVISILTGLVALNIIPLNAISSYINTSFTDSYYSKIIFVISIIFLLISLKFLLSGTGKSKDKGAIEKTSQLGNILISQKCIESIVISAVKQMDGVMDVNIELENEKDSVGVKLNVVVTPENSIPELSALIQVRTKDAIERIAGVGVTTVEVAVEDVIQTIKPALKNRVE